MSEQQAPPPTEETPEQEATEQEIPWQKRYEDIRPQFDRATQRVTELEPAAQQWQRLQEDPEFQAEQFRQLAEAQGYQIQEDQPEEFLDPTDQLRAELEGLREEFYGTRQQAQQAEQIAFLEQNTEERLAQIPDIDERTKDWLVSRAVALPPLPDGTLDLDSAHRELQEWQQDQMKRWAQTKQAPRFSPNGQQGTQTYDLDHPDPAVRRRNRQAYMAERAREMDSQ